MVTMDGEIQQRFPGYLFLARKRLLKKRTPDYVPGIATSSQIWQMIAWLSYCC